MKLVSEKPIDSQHYPFDTTFWLKYTILSECSCAHYISEGYFTFVRYNTLNFRTLHGQPQIANRRLTVISGINAPARENGIFYL